MLTTEAIPSYRCLAVPMQETTIYFRRYADHWFYTFRDDDEVWEEMVVAPEVVELVCGYYPSRTAPLTEYPL